MTAMPESSSQATFVPIELAAAAEMNGKMSRAVSNTSLSQEVKLPAGDTASVTRSRRRSLSNSLRSLVSIISTVFTRESKLYSI